MLGSPSVADGMVFASANVRSYYGVNATTGDIVWNFTDPAATEFIYVHQFMLTVTFSSSINTT